MDLIGLDMIADAMHSPDYEFYLDRRTGEIYPDATLGGRFTFRRFRDAVYSDPSEMGRFFSRFEDAHRRLLALKWLDFSGCVTQSEYDELRVQVDSELQAIETELRAKWHAG